MANNLFELLKHGGPVMYPLAGLSVLAVTCMLERAFFWQKLLKGEHRLVHEVLATARFSLDDARDIAERANHMPIGRFLLAPLKLTSPSPETFGLALEAAGDHEFSLMRKGDKFLETTIAIAPLLGLLGTVIGLMVTFANLNIGGPAAGGGAGSGAPDLSKAAAGIGEALTATATGMVVAIGALAGFRTSVSLQAKQMDYFAKVGSELELIYRQVWYEPYAALSRTNGAQSTHQSTYSPAPEELHRNEV
jgi:biopolymer transport protein ExbB